MALEHKVVPLLERMVRFSPLGDEELAGDMCQLGEIGRIASLDHASTINWNLDGKSDKKMSGIADVRI